jgi:hypothetical protein
MVTRTTDTKQVHVDVAAPQLHLPDAQSTSETIMNQALTYCAEKMRIDKQTALERVQAGDAKARGYCHYNVAKQVAVALGALDDNVKAVYTMNYDATPEDLSLGTQGHATMVHLIVWAQPKTNALHALISSLDQALLEHYVELTGEENRQHLLDVQVVDDAQVKGRTGYGAMLSSIHHRPIQVWEK